MADIVDPGIAAEYLSTAAFGIDTFTASWQQPLEHAKHSGRKKKFSKNGQKRSL
jgi:hypothetical protein